MPAVSVIIPTCNRGPLLRAAVESVFAQTFPDWELIVVDDGSTDDTRAWVESIADHRVRFLAHEHCGLPSVLRNAALAQARGRWVAFLDSDDVWDRDKLERQLAEMQRSPETRWSYSRARWIDESGNALPTPPGRHWRPYAGWILDPLIAWDAWVALPAVIVERTLLEEMGGFDESLRFHEDYDLWLRLARRYPVALVADPLVSIRNHPGNTWRSDHVEMLESFVAVYDRLLADRGLRKAHRLCRRMRMISVTQLADQYRGSRRCRDGVRALLGVLPNGVSSLKWWTSLVKTSGRWVLPRRAPA